MFLLLLVIVVFGATWFLTGVLQRYARAKNLIDIPNERSSHQIPTLRGGGLSIILVLLLSFLFVLLFFPSLQELVWATVGAGVCVGLVGFWDDHRHISARWRLLAHFVAVFLALVTLGGLPPIIMLGYSVDLGWAGIPLSAIYMVWLLNLYNFMDGIDGIASVEAITVGIGASFVTWMVAPDSPAWQLPLLVTCASAGFLIWNYPPAKIFMGDVGSGFLGVVFGVISIHASWIAPQLFWCWLILLGVFIVDATVTLIRRFLRRDWLYEAHRSHAYQYASRVVGGHLPITLSVGLINIFFLFPVSVLVGLQVVDGVIGVIIAYLPLLCLSLYYKAGAKELQGH